LFAKRVERQPGRGDGLGDEPVIPGIPHPARIGSDLPLMQQPFNDRQRQDRLEIQATLAREAAAKGGSPDSSMFHELAQGEVGLRAPVFVGD
jgi:hypothetical protein